MTEIGDWDAASLLLRTNLTERFDTDIDLFLSGSWSHTRPSRTSENPYYKIMGMGLLNSNGELGSPVTAIWSTWVPSSPCPGMPGSAWSTTTAPSTGSTSPAPKIRWWAASWPYGAVSMKATGTSPFIGDNFFATIGVRYYDYEYTGSGNPMGEPMKIAELNSLNALNPVVDKVWDGYLSLTFRY